MTREKFYAGAAFAALALTAVALAPCAQSQTRDTTDPLTFDVASVKASAGCPPACGLIRPTVGNQGYHVEGAFLRALMTVAYNVTDRQISGGPSWINGDRFDIEAKTSRPMTVDELHIMLQHLMEERFHLQLRRETRQEPVWNLVIAQGGPKMSTHDTADSVFQPMSPPQLVRAADGSVCFGLPGRNLTMNYFAFYLSRYLSRSVIDQTGLPARYDENLQFMPDGVRWADGVTPPISPDCSDIFFALPKQLGLRLEAAKGPVEFLVVEHVEKPTEN